MKIATLKNTNLLALVAVSALVTTGFSQTSHMRPHHNADAHGMAVAYPWVFEKGTGTARKTAQMAVNDVIRKAGYSAVSWETAASAWSAGHFRTPGFGQQPTKKSLRAFAKSVHASKVLYGAVSWHTRSIWVNAGPKTISTATVNVFVYDLASNSVSFKKQGVNGRSDEKSNMLKLAAAVLLTPIVTAVSGGPATPQEQRAVQIAIGFAYHNWVLASPMPK